MDENHGFDDLLDRILGVARDDDRERLDAGRVRLDAILEAMGHNWFGSVVLLAGLVTIVPLVGDVPGVPTIMGLLVFLTAGQVLLGREHLWLPGWLRGREVKAETVKKGVDWLRPAARLVDRVVKPRLSILTGRRARQAMAVVCLLVAAAMPLMEMIPFSANIAGVILTVVGLSSVAGDGLLALLALASFGAGLGFALRAV